MGFWIFMLLMDCLIPLTMIGFGKMFRTKPPQNINALFGYRTAMSMKNQETWEFAHSYCGRLWFKSGWILLPFSVLPLLLVFHREIAVIGMVGSIVCAVQLVPLIGSIFLTEAALKKNFDEYGISIR